MVIKRKKTTIDSVDRDILRHMDMMNRNLSGAAIAKKINLSPSAIAPRLVNLKSKGIIKPMKISGMRNFTRIFAGTTLRPPIKKRISAPRSILWGLDIKKSKKGGK